MHIRSFIAGLVLAAAVGPGCTLLLPTAMVAGTAVGVAGAAAGGGGGGGVVVLNPARGVEVGLAVDRAILRGFASTAAAPGSGRAPEYRSFQPAGVGWSRPMGYWRGGPVGRGKDSIAIEERTAVLAKDALSRWREWLPRGTVSQRIAAAVHLASLTELPADALDTLVPALAHDPDSSVRRWAAAALAHPPRAPEVAAQAVAALAAALDDPAPLVRSRAICSLGALGDVARPALPALRRLAAGGGSTADHARGLVATLGG